MALDPARRFLDPDDVAALVVRTLREGGADVVVVGLTAAAIWGMPLPPSAAEQIRSGLVSISRRDCGSPSRQRTVDGHSIDLPPEHLAMRGELRMTTPARTWLDCAAFVKPDHLLAMGDWALDEAKLSIGELEALVRWARRRRGVVRAREVLPLLRPGVESPQESRLRWLVVSAGLPEPEINPEIVLPNGRVVRLDLAYVGLRLGLEFDGDWHAWTQEEDEERRSNLKAAGWTVLVARKDDLSQPEPLLRSVRRAFDRSLSSRKLRW